VTGFVVQPTIFPSEKRGVLTYATVVAVGPPAGGISDQVFRLNSIYDPDYTGGGSTVLGYSQAAALYQRYRVLSARATVTWDNMATNPITAFICATPNTVISTGINYIMGQRFAWSRGIGGVGGNSTLTHAIDIPIYKVFGCPKKQVEVEHDFAATLTGSPQNTVYLHVGAYQNGASSGNYNLQVRIDYTVVLSNPYDLTT
jgi:hypothetical protein